jgi:hypothetical protein
MNWLKDRAKELSTWNAGALLAVGILILVGGGLLKWVAYAAIIWGIAGMIKKG